MPNVKLEETKKMSDFLLRSFNTQTKNMGIPNGLAVMSIILFDDKHCEFSGRISL